MPNLLWAVILYLNLGFREEKNNKISIALVVFGQKIVFIRWVLLQNNIIMEQTNISFPSKYKGKSKDVLSVKSNSLIFSFAIGLVLLAMGLYLFLRDKVTTLAQSSLIPILGLILIFIGILLMLFAPFIGLFKGYNQYLKGDVNINLIKNESDSYPFYSYRVDSDKFESNGNLNNIARLKRVYALTLEKGKMLYIPINILSKESVSFLNDMVSIYNKKATISK